jgi:hypothetical protein
MDKRCHAMDIHAPPTIFKTEINFLMHAGIGDLQYFLLE